MQFKITSIIRALVTIFLTLVTIVVLPKTLLGRDLSLGISPSLIEIDVAEDMYFEYPLIVFNDGNKTLLVSCDFYDFLLDPYGKVVFLSPQEEKHPWSAASWLSSSHDGFILKPGEEKQIYLYVEPVKNSEPGTHRAVVTFSAISQADGKNGETIPVKVKVSSIVLVNFKGEPELKPQISFKASTIYFSKPVFKIIIQNAGNVHFFAKGKFELLDGKGNKISGISLDTPRQQGALVLPDSKRLFDITLERAPLFGIYLARTTIFLTGGKELKSEKAVYILNWKFLLAFIALIMLAIFVYYLVRKYKIVPRELL